MPSMALAFDGALMRGEEIDVTTTTSVPSSADPRATYTRVLLKLGGEMFGGGQVGLDPDVVHLVARQIAEVVRGGPSGTWKRAEW